MNTPDREPASNDAGLDHELCVLLQRGGAVPPPVPADLSARILASAALPLRRRARTTDRDAAGVLATWARIVLPVAAAAGIVLAMNLQPSESSASADTVDTWSLLHSSEDSASRELAELVVSVDGADDAEAAW
jgi:hypothetical protein